MGFKGPRQLILAEDHEAVGIYRLKDGKVTVSQFDAGLAGQAQMDQDGGQVNVNGSLYLARQSGSDGTYTLNGGELTVFEIANPPGSGTGTLNVDGGTLVLTGTAAAVDTLNIGSASGTTGRLDLVNKELAADGLYVGRQGRGTLNMTGGKASRSAPSWRRSPRF